VVTLGLLQPQAKDKSVFYLKNPLDLDSITGKPSFYSTVG
jgi:hypothetical protein